MHLLDRPVWASLSTYQSDISVGGALARRYLSDVNLFVSARDDTVEALEELAALVHYGEQVFVLQVPQIDTPPGLTAVKRAKGVQLVAKPGCHFEAGGAEVDNTNARGARAARAEIIKLSECDAPEMLALAKLTEPGPFLTRTHVMGAFLGIRVAGRLAAMAGERFRFPGYAEVSGVCTHPDFRGRGFARMLSAAVSANIQSRSEQPFLHAWKTNVPAIALYESLGFETRAEVNVAVFTRERG
jgi:predicted GNAT family acetyltransferase